MTLTYSQLNTACLNTLVTPNGYQPSLKIGLEVLYLTGCRPQELMSEHLWSEHDIDNLQLQTLKGGGQRIIPKDGLPVEFVHPIEFGSWYFNLVRISQLYNSFLKTWAYPSASVGGKETKLYVFRYRFVKSLVRDGYSEAEIQTIMAWSTVSLVGRYSGAQIDV